MSRASSELLSVGYPRSRTEEDCLEAILPPNPDRFLSCARLDPEGSLLGRRLLHLL